MKHIDYIGVQFNGNKKLKNQKLIEIGDGVNKDVISNFFENFKDKTEDFLDETYEHSNPLESRRFLLNTLFLLDSIR